MWYLVIPETGLGGGSHFRISIKYILELKSPSVHYTVMPENLAMAMKG